MTNPNTPDFLSATHEQVQFVEEIPSRKALFHDEYPALPEALKAVLPEKLYWHQAEAIRAAQAHQDVLVVTGTNSGKSLCFQVPALQACMEEPMARALFLFPTKALAQDQAQRMTGIATQLGLRVGTYDGDTPKSHRSAIRNLSHIVMSNPDMLHTGILPAHSHWTKFLKALRVIAIDELHSYRGVFGSHVALVVRRLLRLCAMYHNYPQVIACSATIGNPEELFERLVGRKPVTVNLDGSPSGRRTVVFLNPPLLPNNERLSTNVATSEALATLIENEQTTLAFSRSRITTELVLRYTKQRLPDNLTHLVESYRSGYTPKERRQIEQAILKGKIRGLSSTNALELGVDIGNLDAVIINTYPGSVSSFWQQAGRAGRGTKDAVTVYIAGDNPLEQYLLEHPQRILDGKSESVTIQPSNPVILSSQLLCAAYERPIAPSELEFFGEKGLEVAETLDRSGELKFQSGLFYYPGFEPPSLKVNIRGASRDQFSLLVAGQEIGLMEYGRALSQAHPGAIYLHRGEPFEVEELDLVQRNAHLSRFQGNYYTQAKVQSLLESGNPYRQGGPFSVSGCRVTTTVIGYSKKSFDGDTVLDVLDLELPPTTFDTVCLRIDLPQLDLERPPDVQIAGVHGLEHALLGLAPLFGGCDRQDIGSSWFAFFLETQCPVVFLYDQVPGGVGISDAIFANADMLVQAALQRITLCKCVNGCPGCLYLSGCEFGNESLDKSETIRLLRWLTAHG
jgi:DEAD/DEAH box helicase domain-containing protein